jgi:hypothetical protein
MSEGFITIAFGQKKYIDMAKALILSYKLQGGRWPFAIVTNDANYADLSKLFDVVIRMNPDFGPGVVQKLHLDAYSPFDRTLFVDSDCLFYKSPDLVWNSYAIEQFTVRGWRYLTGATEYEMKHPYEWVNDMRVFLGKTEIERFAHFNSGLLFFDSSDAAKDIFKSAREIYIQRADLGFVEFKNAPIADEPAFSVAMERHHVAMLAWDNVNAMETAIGMRDTYGINVLQGRSKFNKNGHDVNPALIHFNVEAQTSVAYNREICRLEAKYVSAINAYLKFASWLIKMLGLRVRRFIESVPGRYRNGGAAGLLPKSLSRAVSRLLSTQTP